MWFLIMFVVNEGTHMLIARYIFSSSTLCFTTRHRRISKNSPRPVTLSILLLSWVARSKIIFLGPSCVVQCTLPIEIDPSSRNNEWIPIVRRGQPPIPWLETNAVYQSICECLPLLVALLCPSLSVLFFLLLSSVSALMILNTDRESRLS